MIRPMRREDIALVEELEKACFAKPWTAQLLEEGLNSKLDAYLVLEAADERALLGYANLRILAGEGELMRIAVSPALRGKGYGKQLMDAVVTFSKEKEVKALTLEVRMSNQIARNLYNSYGFCEEGFRKNYYNNPTEDAVVMWKHGI